MYSDSEALCFDSVVTKTKAHRDISAITNVEELVDATGNDQADHGAKTRATSLAATEADLMFFKEARLNWLGAARVVAGALAAFGPPKLQFGVLKRLKTATPPKLNHWGLMISTSSPGMEAKADGNVPSAVPSKELIKHGVIPRNVKVLRRPRPWMLAQDTCCGQLWWLVQAAR